MGKGALLQQTPAHDARFSETPTTAGLTISVTSDLAAVEGAWRALEADGVESPGQSFDFIRLWVETLGIPAGEQLYVLAEADGRPLALLPLRRRRKLGVRLLSWFAGDHVGCHGPLVDAARLAALGPRGRAVLWQRMAEVLDGADLLYLPDMPEEVCGVPGLLAELGSSSAADTLYRAAFGSWETCNATQRSKSRRKHDRQQGERLEALGTVSFDEMEGDGDGAALAVLFRQRAARFAEMGVTDPFEPAAIRRFYEAAAAPGSGVAVKLHVLRLDGEIVAMRYNIACGDRLFCLISSMSDDPAIQGGSPGKQCLLRVMQTVFDQGFGAFDMGAGFTDEKRHWCNRQIGLRVHYWPLTPKGAAAATVRKTLQQARRRIKSDPVLLAAAKRARLWLSRLRGSTPAA